MDLISGAGLVVKLVLLVLVYFSVVSWTIIFFKLRIVHRATRDSDRFLDFFWSKKRFDLIQQGAGEFSASPLTVLFRDGYQELVRGQKKAEGEQHEPVADLGRAENVAAPCVARRPRRRSVSKSI